MAPGRGEQHASTLRDLYTAADAALYRAKAYGRDGLAVSGIPAPEA